MSDEFEIESTHAIYVNRLASKQVKKLNEFWKTYLLAMKLSLDEYGSELTAKQLNKLIREISKIIQSNMGDAYKQLEIDLFEFAEYELDFQAKAIQSNTDEDIAVPSTAQIISSALETPVSTGAGAVSLENWKRALTERQIEQVEQTIKLAYASGTTNSELVREIIGTKKNKYQDGIIEMSRRHATSLVRTSINHYASTAKKKLFEQNSSLISGHEIVSTLDSRTSAVCRSLDGVRYIYKKKKAVKYPPFHPNCRTTMIPILKGDENKENTGTRASVGASIDDDKLVSDPKQISSKTRYYNFLKNQPAEFQDDVLGKTKGKIFRNSGLTADEFGKLLVDRMGKELTIKELAEKDKRIFNYLYK